MTHPLAAPILEALLTHYDLVSLVRKYFAITADHRNIIRKSHVAAKLAEVLDVANSPAFRSRLSKAARDAGFSRVKHRAGVAYYCRMVAK